MIASGKLYDKPVVFVNVYAPNVADVILFERVVFLLPDFGIHVTGNTVMSGL